MPTLRWLTRDDDVKAADAVPYRLLEEVPELSYGDRDTGNMLIQGDNLDALKALLPYYAGKIKCIYIDPPFNTGQAFEHYDDNVEHSVWLGLHWPRFELLRGLLAENGTLVVHLDDNQLAYATVILDELFGRKNRITFCTFKQGSAVGHKSINPGMVTTTNYLIVYAKNKNEWTPNKVFTSRERDKRYSKYIENVDENFKDWTLTSLNKAFCEHHESTISDLKKKWGKENYEAKLSEFVLNNPERVIRDARPDYKAVGQETRDLIDHSKKHPNELFLQKREKHSDIYLKDGERWLFYKDKLKLIDGVWVSGEPLTNLWDDLLSNNLHNEGGVKFPKSKKPEALVKRCFELFTDENDWVLDSFLGSGTTAAVAHKFRRHYIGIEMGDHATTLCKPRLDNVVDGDQSGVSKAINWDGGGGFRFFKLGPSIFDETGQIRPDIEFHTLAAHIWFYEVGLPWDKPQNLTPILGQHEGKSYALLYNGVLGDKQVNGGNVLTRQTLKVIRNAMDIKTLPIVIYGERSALSESSLKREKITFKQTPYDVKARA
ncbi:MAG: site-specific DNA-methyltransferase [Maricaulaceae bacterium]